MMKTVPVTFTPEWHVKLAFSVYEQDFRKVALATTEQGRREATLAADEEFRSNLAGVRQVINDDEQFFAAFEAVVREVWANCSFDPEMVEGLVKGYFKAWLGVDR